MSGSDRGSDRAARDVPSGAPPVAATHTVRLEATMAKPVSELSGEEVLIALLHGWSLSDLVPRVLEVVERDPLASGGWFRGDYLRVLMQMPGGFWTLHPMWYARYRTALRASAAIRRPLAPGERMEFWNDLGSFVR